MDRRADPQRRTSYDVHSEYARSLLKIPETLDELACARQAVEGVLVRSEKTLQRAVDAVCTTLELEAACKLNEEAMATAFGKVQSAADCMLARLVRRRAMCSCDGK